MSELELGDFTKIVWEPTDRHTRSVNTVRQANGFSLECEYFIREAGEVHDCHLLATCIVTHRSPTTRRVGTHDYCTHHAREMANRVCMAEGIVTAGHGTWGDLARANPVPVEDRDDDEAFFATLREALGVDTEVEHVQRRNGLGQIVEIVPPRRRRWWQRPGGP